MITITFDTLRYANMLKEAGISDKQAEAMVNVQKQILNEVLDTSLATKADVAIGKKELSSEIEAVRRDMKEMEIRLVKWMIAMVAGQGTLVVLAIKLMGR
ncbi:MAG: DUF1640 domain-containing protein [Magnetococcales bacterium]|nr:DUF1640 domain-containing protein [Magnetococcales bacterium]